MKKKITIALDENILSGIDGEVFSGKAKNRSSAIESCLVKYYGDFTNISVIIFAYDNKWDNRDYPFDTPKSLLQVRGEAILSHQICMFLKLGISDIHIVIPTGKEGFFKDCLGSSFPQSCFTFYECYKDHQTGEALDIVMKKGKLKKDIFISNGDIFYGSLDIKKYYKFYKRHGADFSFCLKFVMTPEQLGNVVIQGEKVVSFVEKPKAKATYLTNSGLYVTSKKFLGKVNYGKHLETDFFPFIPDSSHTVGFLYSGEWEHIQNDSAFERINGKLM